MGSPPQSIVEFFNKYDWTQGCFCRDSKENAVYVDNEAACSFCLMGAAIRIYRYDTLIFREINDKIFHKTGMWAGAWNDVPGRTKQEVIDLCKELGI